MQGRHCVCIFFFFNDTATTEIYTLSLHDALPIYLGRGEGGGVVLEPGALRQRRRVEAATPVAVLPAGGADEQIGEHTSELQSRQYLVCRLLLEKKKTKHYTHYWRSHIIT